MQTCCSVSCIAQPTSGLVGFHKQGICPGIWCTTMVRENDFKKASTAKVKKRKCKIERLTIII